MDAQQQAVRARGTFDCPMCYGTINYTEIYAHLPDCFAATAKKGGVPVAFDRRDERSQQREAISQNNDRSSSKQPKSRRSVTSTSITRNRAVSSSPCYSPESFSQQKKMPNEHLDQLGICPVRISSPGRGRELEIAPKTKRFWWIKHLFSHHSFRLAEAYESELGPHLPDPPTFSSFSLSFEDCIYQFKGPLPSDFSFSTTEKSFNRCVGLLAELVASKRAIQMEGKGEGSHEYELYMWLYSCFLFGCSRELNRAWRGTVMDNEFLLLPDEQWVYTAEEVRILVEKQEQPPRRYSKKRWQPDGMVGFTEEIVSQVFGSTDFAKCRISEDVFLGFVAIEHKKDTHEMADVNMLAYEMYLLCKAQKQIGMKYPLAFGIYWAGTIFMLFFMEVCEEKYVSHQILQLDSKEADQLVLIFRALWYLRLHGRNLAHKMETLSTAKFLATANVYVYVATSGGNSRGTPGSSGQSPNTRKEESPGEKDQNRENPGGSRGSNKGTQEQNKPTDQPPPTKNKTITCDETGQVYEVLPTVIRKSSATKLQLAKNVETGEVVVLKKRLDRNSRYSSTELQALRLLQEAPGIVRLRGTCFEEKSHTNILILEYVDKVLKLHDAGVTTPMLCTFFSQLLKALDGCRYNQVVHHDLKPSNVLFTPDQKTVLVDFDHAKILRTESRTKNRCTAGYTPPELANGRSVPVASSIDIWSAGIMLLEVLLNLRVYSDEAAWRLVEVLHTAPVDRTTEHIADWITNLQDEEDPLADDIWMLPLPENEDEWKGPSLHCCKEAFHLVRWMLAVNPACRPFPKDALQHPFLSPGLLPSSKTS
ncbi:Glycogen synthase kinase-3 beta [Balamuthia mandrillaris]